MHKLKAITPLGGTEPQVDTFAGLTVSENASRALASLSLRIGEENQGKTAAASFLGFDLPEPGKVSANNTFSAWWLGPDSWMIDADHGAHELLASALKTELGDAVSVVEQTDGWCRYDVQGPRCNDVFERLCNVNIRAMEAGDATRTSIEHLGCFLLCVEADARFVVIGPRSSAGSLHHALVTAARSAI